MDGAESVTPSGERVRKAIKWLSEATLSQPEKPRRELLEQADPL